MSIPHCGKKLMVYNVLKTLFVDAIPKPSNICLHKRNLSHVAHLKVQPQRVIDYNKILKAHAMTFKKKSKGHVEASKLLKEMKAKGIEPNSQTYLQLIIGMSTQRHRNNVQNDRLEKWFDELFILESKKEKKRSASDKMEKILQHLSTYGHPNLKAMFLKIIDKFELDISYWHLAMKGCIKSRNIGDAEELLNIARQKNIASMLSYKILIDSHLYCKDQKSASRIFSSMLNDKVTADCGTYELFVNYYMEQPFTPENLETLDKLWQAVVMTTTEATVPDDIIEKFIRYYGKHGELSKAEQVYLDIKSKKSQKLDRKSVGGMNKVIVGFAHKKQLPSAISLYYDMIGEGYKPSKYVLSKLIQAYKLKSDEETIQQLLDVTDKLNLDAKIAH